MPDELFFLQSALHNKEVLIMWRGGVDLDAFEVVENNNVAVRVNIRYYLQEFQQSTLAPPRESASGIPRSNRPQFLPLTPPPPRPCPEIDDFDCERPPYTSWKRNTLKPPQKPT